MVDSEKLNRRTINALKNAGLDLNTDTLREWVKTGRILRIKGVGKATRKQLMDYP
jgi:hypothetical protein